MYFVYLMRSESVKYQTYVGFTSDLNARLSSHNRGSTFHTRKYRPWVIESYFAFADKEKALDFERYLKSYSGKAFAKKHFW